MGGKYSDAGSGYNVDRPVTAVDHTLHSHSRGQRIGPESVPRRPPAKLALHHRGTHECHSGMSRRERMPVGSVGPRFVNPVFEPLDCTDHHDRANTMRHRHAAPVRTGLSAGNLHSPGQCRRSPLHHIGDLAAPRRVCRLSRPMQRQQRQHHGHGPICQSVQHTHCVIKALPQN